MPSLQPAHQPHHRLQLDAQLGALHLDIALTLTAPWTTLFGPSGSGKSTILRAACGLTLPEPATRLRFECCNPTLDLTTLPPGRRLLAYAPQHSTLFPHFDVATNISFPYEVEHFPAAMATLIEEVNTLFELHVFADRMPHELSGGERQRVNLARAFATPDARLLLLDEPFSGLDRTLRDRLLPRMQQWSLDRGIPILSVTHDIDEALLLQSEVVRLDAGHITAQGPAHEVLANEKERLLGALHSSSAII